MATIAATAPWVGLIGTLVGIHNAFVGVDGNKASILGAIAKALSDACQPLALGLLVGLIGLWGYRYLSGRMEILDCEMKNATLELTNRLSVYCGRR